MDMSTFLNTLILWLPRGLRPRCTLLGRCPS